jgi:glycosyltransferase involved in cell wall biosynthesis
MPNVKALAVIIPSRQQPAQERFLTRAIASIRAQSFDAELQVQVRVGIDRGAAVPPGLEQSEGVQVVESPGNSQGAALNAAARALDADYVAFLEDDDEWHPSRVALGLRALTHGDFSSSTQLEVDEDEVVVQINDFPTPSGWFMPMATWEKVGAFNENYRYRLDNEWLGRLGESGLRRIHLIEATAPVRFEIMKQVRPFLAAVIEMGGPCSEIRRHELPMPVIKRTVHAESGTARIGAQPAMERQSQDEYDRLIKRFGRVPW